jgi:hypothetical protein
MHHNGTSTTAGTNGRGAAEYEGDSGRIFFVLTFVFAECRFDAVTNNHYLSVFRFASAGKLLYYNMLDLVTVY